MQFMCDSRDTEVLCAQYSLVVLNQPLPEGGENKYDISSYGVLNKLRHTNSKTYMYM
jgi:hypothetical protein